MRAFAITVILATLAVACRQSGNTSNHSLDTALVYINAPKVAPVDSHAWDRARDSVLAAVAAYRRGQISADSVAAMMMKYVERTQRFLSVRMDDSLRAALRRRRHR